MAIATPKRWIRKGPWQTNIWELHHLLSRWYIYIYIYIHIHMYIVDPLGHGCCDCCDPFSTSACWTLVVLGGCWEIGPRIEDGFGAKVSDSWEFQQVPPGHRWCDNSFDKDDWFINVLKDINHFETNLSISWLRNKKSKKSAMFTSVPTGSVDFVHQPYHVLHFCAQKWDPLSTNSQYILVSLMNSMEFPGSLNRW